MGVEPRTVFQFDPEKAVVALYERDLRSGEDVLPVIRQRTGEKTAPRFEKGFQTDRTL